MKRPFKLFSTYLKRKESKKREIEYLCALRLSYNNFNEKVSVESKDLYKECLCR